MPPPCVPHPHIDPHIDRGCARLFPHADIGAFVCRPCAGRYVVCCHLGGQRRGGCVCACKENSPWPNHWHRLPEPRLKLPRLAWRETDESLSGSLPDLETNFRGDAVGSGSSCFLRGLSLRRRRRQRLRPLCGATAISLLFLQVRFPSVSAAWLFCTAVVLPSSIRRVHSQSAIWRCAFPSRDSLARISHERERALQRCRARRM